MSKPVKTEIKKKKSPWGENCYYLYLNGKLVRQDVPFETLEAAPEMLEEIEQAIRALRIFIKTNKCPTLRELQNLVDGLVAAADRALGVTK